MASAPTKSASGVNPPTSGRLRILAGALFLCVLALPISRWILLRKPPLPPETASLDSKRDYWRQRLKSDVADKDAYLALGTMEERRGYFTVAVRYLLAARSLGASDADVSGPLGRALLALARDEEALPELERAAKLRPDSLEATLNLAGLYVMQEQPKVASQLLTRFTDAHPSLNSDDLRRLAFAQLESENNAAAKTLAERILATKPDDPDAHSIAARSALSLKNLEDANKHTAALLTLSGGEASVRYLHGLTLNALGKTDAAIEQWQKAVEQNPAALDALEQLGEAQYKRGDYAAAAKCFESLARRAPGPATAGRAADAFIKLNQKERAAYWRAVQVGSGGDFRAALTLGRIAQASPDPEIQRKGLEATAEAYRGLRQKDQYLAAMQKLTAGGSVDDLRQRARAYENLDRHEDQTRCLQEAIQKAPDAQKSVLLYELARSYRGRGMRDEAEKALEEACQRSPKVALLHRELADVYFERQALEGRLAKAIRSWETTIALDSKNGNSENSSDRQNLGIAYGQSGEWTKAAATLEHAIDLEPGSGPAYLELGRALTKLGDKESAKRNNALYAKYVAFDQQRQTLRTRANRPGSPAADLIAYADLLTKMHLPEEAAAWYEKALAKTPNDDALRKRLSSLYYRLRQPEKQTATMAGGRR